MTESPIDLNGFIIAMCEGPNRWINQATDGLTEEQLFYQRSGQGDLKMVVER